MKRISVIVCVCLMLLACADGARAASLLGDFTGASNPGNGWTQGYAHDSVDLPMGLFVIVGTPGDRWTGDATGIDEWPSNGAKDVLLVNIGSGNTEWNHWGGGAITWETEQAYHTWAGSGSGSNPYVNGDDTIFSTYTVPAAGVYSIAAAWDLVDGGHAAGVEVQINNSSVFSGNIDNSNVGVSDLASFGTSMSLSAGDTVSFRTSPNDVDGGAAALNASVEIVPEPSSVLLLVCAMLAVGGMRRGV